MQPLLLVALGGALGAVARWSASGALSPLSAAARFPWATFVVNISGCALIGLLTALALRFPHFGGPAKLFLVTGFCGGFTTFSTFGLETFELLRRGEFLTAALYAGASFAAGLLALAAAFWLAGGAKS